MAVRTLADLRAHREEVLAVLARYGALNPRVFGSVAQGRESENSDIDLLVDLPRDTGLFQLAQLQIDLADRLQRNVDLVTPEELHPRIRESVLRSAVPL